MKKIMYILVITATLGVSFMATGGLVWLICWAFSLTFSWKITLGVWVVWFILNQIFSKK